MAPTMIRALLLVSLIAFSQSRVLKTPHAKNTRSRSLKEDDEIPIVISILVVNNCVGTTYEFEAISPGGGVCAYESLDPGQEVRVNAERLFLPYDSDVSGAILSGFSTDYTHIYDPLPDTCSGGGELYDIENAGPIIFCPDLASNPSPSPSPDPPTLSTFVVVNTCNFNVSWTLVTFSSTSDPTTGDMKISAGCSADGMTPIPIFGYASAYYDPSTTEKLGIIVQYDTVNVIAPPTLSHVGDWTGPSASGTTCPTSGVHLDVLEYPNLSDAYILCPV
jgi:hypothetical protein